MATLSGVIYSCSIAKTKFRTQKKFHMLCRHRPIMPKILPIMLLSIAQKLSLLCSKLFLQNQDYALELTVLLEYISLS